MSAYVSLEKITKRYGEIVAANDVSLKIEEHEFVTLLGPSGSWKIINSNLRPSNGFVDGL